MNTSLQDMPSESATDRFFDVASIVAAVLIGLVVLVLAHPRFGTDLGTVWRHQGAQSSQVTNGAAGR
jgi:hypothetical protein